MTKITKQHLLYRIPNLTLVYGTQL